MERSLIAHKGKAVVMPPKQLLMYIVRLVTFLALIIWTSLNDLKFFT